jgi:hypothetical protein
MNYRTPSFQIHRYDATGHTVVPSVPVAGDPNLTRKSRTIAPGTVLLLLAVVAFGAMTIGEWVHSILVAYNNAIVSSLLVLAVPVAGLCFYGLVKLVGFCRYQREISDELSEHFIAYEPSEVPAELMILDPAMRSLPDHKTMPSAGRRRVAAPVWERRRILGAERRALPFPDRRGAFSYLQAA